MLNWIEHEKSFITLGPGCIDFTVWFESFLCVSVVCYCLAFMCCCYVSLYLGIFTELQIRGAIDENSKIVFLIPQPKPTLWTLIRTISVRWVWWGVIKYVLWSNKRNYPKIINVTLLIWSTGIRWAFPLLKKKQKKNLDSCYSTDLDFWNCFIKKRRIIS